MAGPKQALVYIVGVIVVIAMAYVVYLATPQLSVTTTSTTVPTPVTTTSTTPSGVSGCPNIYYVLNGSITGYSGFSEYNLNYNGGTIRDYVIAGGSSGTLNVTESVTKELPGYASVTRAHTVFFEGMGPGVNATSAHGIGVTARPANYTIANNTYANFTITIYANQSAPNRTYWTYIDGPCGGRIAPILITVGSGPYSGNVVAPGSTFA